MKTLIFHGAESKVYIQGDKIIKERFKKAYRHEKIDSSLRRSRTRREAKILDKLKGSGIHVPRLIDSDNNQTIVMELIEGVPLRDVFEKNPSIHAKAVAKLVAQLHDSRIIHGDLTTSNMIASEKGIVLIDFGLSYFSHKVEDMAVDIHLLRQALCSKHYRVSEKAFEIFIMHYQKYASHGKDTISRLVKVENRGRYKRSKSRS